jgi:hypothetical protein
MVISNNRKQVVPLRVASIDVGTNTILLLIAEIEGEKLKPLFEMETIVRLGEGVQKNGILLQVRWGRWCKGKYFWKCYRLGGRPPVGRLKSPLPFPCAFILDVMHNR